MKLSILKNESMQLVFPQFSKHNHKTWQSLTSYHPLQLVSFIASKLIPLIRYVYSSLCGRWSRKFITVATLSRAGPGERPTSTSNQRCCSSTARSNQAGRDICGRPPKLRDLIENSNIGLSPLIQARIHRPRPGPLYLPCRPRYDYCGNGNTPHHR